MDQESTSFQQENARLSIIVDKLLELFPDPYAKYKNSKQSEQLEIREGEYLGNNEVSKPERPWFQKLQELSILLPYDAQSPVSRKFPNKNIQREEIFQNIYAKLHLTLIIGKYKFEDCGAKNYDQYREFLQQTNRFLKRFDNGILTPVNLILWTYIVMNIDPKGEIETECDERMACFMNTQKLSTPDEEQAGQQILDELEKFVGQINNSPVLSQIYAEFSKQFQIPYGQDLREAFQYCKLHYIHDSEIHGITLLDGTIILNLYQVTKFSKKEGLNKKQIKTMTAYYLIVLLRQSAHFFLRKQFNEFEINTKEKVLAIDVNARNFESGAILENILMPQKINDSIQGISELNNKMAKFLVNPNSWQLSLNEFQNTLQSLSQLENTTIKIRLNMGNHTSSNYIKFSQYCSQPRPKMRKIA